MSASTATGTPTAGPITDPKLFELDELAAGLPVEEAGTATSPVVEETRVVGLPLFVTTCVRTETVGVLETLAAVLLLKGFDEDAGDVD
jgi:hypothetical protein